MHFLCSKLHIDIFLIFLCAVQSANRSLSPEPIKAEGQEVEDEAGSFSPKLFHGDENEEAIDPEEDRALLVNLIYYLI